jgi:hypothetical protein
MNFDEAIAAHGLWKQKLADYLAKHDGSLKHDDISRDNKCVLGQWIYGDGLKYSKLPGPPPMMNRRLLALE